MAATPAGNGAVDAGMCTQAPPKRPRRSTSDFIREQQLRQGRPAPPRPFSDGAVALDALAAAPPQLGVDFATPITEQVNLEGQATDSAQHFQSATQTETRQLGLAAALERRDSKPADPDLLLGSSESLAADLSLKTAMRLATPHLSFRWLRRLPPALRCQQPRAADTTREAVREAVLEVCRECLPQLTSDPDKAVRWMERIAACLSWYQLDGPPMPSKPLARPAGAPQEDRSAGRRIEEWDEAYRSLEVLLRQGLLSSFVIVADRFSVLVFGEGTGPWTAPRDGSTQQPTQAEPCAVMCPSMDEFRTMLQENHVAFDVAEVLGDASKPQDGHLGSRATAEAPAEGNDARAQALVPAATAGVSTMEEIRSDLRELRKHGELVRTPDEVGRVAPLSSALWFRGAWRVHALLDVLRQHFLAAPLPSSPSRPARLPRLLAPAPFNHATVRSAEVVKTQTVRSGGAPGAALQEGAVQYTAELSGCFFPGQVRRLLELLRVPLPSFACGLSAESRHNVGINSFTQLGMRRIEAVECKCTGGTNWRWEFKLGA